MNLWPKRKLWNFNPKCNSKDYLSNWGTDKLILFSSLSLEQQREMAHHPFYGKELSPQGDASQVSTKFRSSTSSSRNSITWYICIFGWLLLRFDRYFKECCCGSYRLWTNVLPFNNHDKKHTCKLAIVWACGLPSNQMCVYFMASACWAVFQYFIWEPVSIIERDCCFVLLVNLVQLL